MSDRIRFITHEGKQILLVDLSNCSAAQADEICHMVPFDRPHIKRSAWVGTESLPKVFYQNVKSFSQRDLPTFKTREEALEWLVKE